MSIDEDDDDTIIPSASGINNEEFKKSVDKINVGKTKYEDKNLLSVVKESIAKKSKSPSPAKERKEEERVSTAGSQNGR